MKILTSPQLRCGEEGIIYNKNYIPREYIGDHPVPSYACLPTEFMCILSERHHVMSLIWNC